MDSNKLKRSLEEYKGYQPQTDRELKSIEECLFKRIASTLRPVSSETPVININKIDNMNSIEKEETLSELKSMKGMSTNYLIPNYCLYLMEHVHENWIRSHKKELENNEFQNARKFVPLELLPWSDVKNYYSVAKPILDAMEIPTDEQDVKEEFDRSQLVFMIKNQILSPDDLKDKVKDLVRFYPQIIELGVNDLDKKSIQNLCEQDEIADEISKRVNENVDLNIANRIKNIFAKNSKDVGILMVTDEAERKRVYRFTENLVQRKIGFKRVAYPRPNKPVTKDTYELARFASVFYAKNLKVYDYKYYNASGFIKSVAQYKPYEKCTEEQRRLIDKRARKLKKFEAEMAKKKADVPGIISLVITGKNEREANDKRRDDSHRFEIIQIPVTKKELVKMQVLPEEVGWEKESKAKLSPNAKVFMARANQVSNSNLNKQEQGSNSKNTFREELVEMARQDGAEKNDIKLKNPNESSKKNQDIENDNIR